MSAMKKLQEVHDRMLASMPEGKCLTDCPFCSGEFASLVEGETVGDKTYTEGELEAQVAAAVATATSELTSQVAVLQAAAEEAAKKKMDPEDIKDGGADEDKEKSNLTAQVAELTVKLDAAVLEATSAKAAHEEIVNWLEAEAASVILEAEKATLKAERIAKVAEVVTFPEEYVSERAENWAALEDVQFEALLADYQALGAKVNTPGSGPLPRATAMQASRETSDSTVVGSAAIELIRGRNYGVDVRATR